MTAFRFNTSISGTAGIARLLVVAGLLVTQAGCATYYSHYAMFPAENSKGEPRTVRLSWDTAEYPGWWFVSDRATPLTVETQCSERVWKLYDASHAEAEGCGQGIRACGQPGQDRLVESRRPAGADDQCMSVRSSDSEARIADIPGRLELVVACEPVSPVRGEGKEAVNVDYIRASTVPYTVYSRKAPRGAFNARPPKFERSVCDAE
ncbi:hypothetical protein [Marinobacter sediminicola]|uniref:hypothetical protein n=1 Tax=Marinobacter sediminicola TaxID=3072994 RepID=UPI002811674B|nr:hypothetical protein [Marinobacter sp. F26243]